MAGTEPTETEIETKLNTRTGNRVTFYTSSNPEESAKREAKTDASGKGVYVDSNLPETDERGVTVYRSDGAGDVYQAVQNSLSDWKAIRYRYGHRAEFQPEESEV